MKFKKPRAVLVISGVLAFAIAAALFFLVPIFCGDKFQYNGINAFVEGIKALFTTFNFENVIFTATIILFFIAVVGTIIYGIVSIQRKHKVHLLFALLTLIFVFGSFVTISTYFLADVEFNGVVGKLLTSMMKVDGQTLGKVLSSLVIAFAILSNILFVIHMFVAMISMIITDEVKAFEEKKAKETADKVNEAVTAVNIAHEKAEEAIAMEKEIATEEAFEERKARETKLFQECIDSGYFTEYDEVELPDAIEGVDEEPVYESSIVEEKSVFINKQSVHVGYTHD